MAAQVDSPRTAGRKKCRDSGIWSATNRFSLLGDDDGPFSASIQHRAPHETATATSSTTSFAGDNNNNNSQSLLLEALHENNNSQFSMMSHSQGMSEVLTQNAEFTQMTQDDEAGPSLSPLPPYSPVNPQKVPWGRLIPSFGDSPIDLLPRTSEKTESSETPPPVGDQQVAFSFKKCGLERLQPSDIFNTYCLGRSSNKCDVTATKPRSSSDASSISSEYKLQDWAYGMISNRHCRIFCALKDENAALASAVQSNANNGTAQVEATFGIDVWVENFSSNGTVINQTTVLRRGQKRLLHSGDEVSLVNPETLRKKVPNNDALVQRVIQRHSYVFLNVVNQPVRQQQPQISGSRMMPPAQKEGQNLMQPPASGPSTTSSTKRRRGLVDIRAMNYHTRHQKSGATHSGATTASKTSSRRSPVPPALTDASKKRTPKSGNAHANRTANFVARPVPGAPLSPFPSPSPPRDESSFRPLRRVEEEYDIRDKLGAGTCGEVRRAIHRTTGKEFAVKVISLGLIGGFNGNKNKEAKSMEAEARILQSLDDHPYITKFYDVFVAPNVAMYLVMELLKGGDLFDRIVARGRYTEINSRRTMRRLLAAIHYLHQECNIVHRDLKPENILVRSQNNDIDICLTDFGLAKQAGKGGLKTFCGTDLYLAPEVLRRRHSVKGLGHYGKGADMWSVGVILYILLSGSPPFDVDGGGMDTVLHNAEISFPDQLWSNISADGKDLVKRMLVADPQRRITVQEACEHKWFLEEDGDTHKHPLDDPKLPSRTRKRLFTASPNPSLNSESAKLPVLDEDEDEDESDRPNKQSCGGHKEELPDESQKESADSPADEDVNAAKANALVESDFKADNEKCEGSILSHDRVSNGGVHADSPKVPDKARLNDTTNSTNNAVALADGASKGRKTQSKEVPQEQDPPLRQRKRPAESKTEKVSFQLAETPKSKLGDDTIENPAEFPLSPNHMPQRFRESVEKNIQSKRKKSNNNNKSKLPDQGGESSTHDTPRQTTSSKMEGREGRKVTPFATVGEVEDEINSQFSDDECESINSFGPSQDSNSAPTGKAGEGKSLTQSTLSPFAAPRAKPTNRKRKGGPDEHNTSKPSKTDTLKQSTLPGAAMVEADDNKEPSPAKKEGKTFTAPAPKRQRKTEKKPKTQKNSSAINKAGDTADGKSEKSGKKQMKLSGWFTKPQK